MHGLSCDRCGKSLLVDEEVRYVLRLAITAAYDPPELTRADLEADARAELRRLVAAAAAREARDLEEEIHAERVRDLCPPCRDAMLADPFAPPRRDDSGAP